MIVLARLCDLCGEFVTSRTITNHYAEQHGTWQPSAWRLTCWPDGTAVIVHVEADTLDIYAEVEV